MSVGTSFTLKTVLREPQGSTDSLGCKHKDRWLRRYWGWDYWRLTDGQSSNTAHVTPDTEHRPPCSCNQPPRCHRARRQTQLLLLSPADYLHVMAAFIPYSWFVIQCLLIVLGNHLWFNIQWVISLPRNTQSSLCAALYHWLLQYYPYLTRGLLMTANISNI